MSASREDDPIAGLLSLSALAALRRWIESSVAEQIEAALPRAIEDATASPWLDTKHAAGYLGITENALRLRHRAGLVDAYRDPAGRLRFHREHLDQSMTPEARKPRPGTLSVRYSGRSK
jgi:hypothetical protein